LAPIWLALDVMPLNEANEFLLAHTTNTAVTATAMVMDITFCSLPFPTYSNDVGEIELGLPTLNSDASSGSSFLIAHYQIFAFSKKGSKGVQDHLPLLNRFSRIG
jgi:hypothetical protein